MTPVYKSFTIMEVKVIKSGKNDRGFWSWVQAEPVPGFIATAFITTTTALTVDKTGVAKIPTAVFNSLEWKY